MATLLNCDMGESYGLYRLGDDAALMPLIDVANVACGFHASDFNHMRATVRLAREHGVAVDTEVAKVGDDIDADGSILVDAVELVASGHVQLVVNTPRGRGPRLGTH